MDARRRCQPSAASRMARLGRARDTGSHDFLSERIGCCPVSRATVTSAGPDVQCTRRSHIDGSGKPALLEGFPASKERTQACTCQNLPAPVDRLARLTSSRCDHSPPPNPAPPRFCNPRKASCHTKPNTTARGLDAIWHSSQSSSLHRRCLSAGERFQGACAKATLIPSFSFLFSAFPELTETMDAEAPPDRRSTHPGHPVLETRNLYKLPCMHPTQRQCIADLSSRLLSHLQQASSRQLATLPLHRRQPHFAGTSTPKMCLLRLHYEVGSGASHRQRRELWRWFPPPCTSSFRAWSILLHLSYARYVPHVLHFDLEHPLP